MTINERKENLNLILKELHSFEIEDDANFKFMNLLRSRLMEEGVPIDDAVKIVANLDYDLSAVSEDDDYIGDVALSYAEFAARVYRRLKATGWHRNLSDNIIKKYFNQRTIAL